MKAWVGDSAFSGILRFVYRPLVRRAARQILQGRFLDPARPEKGRWLRRDVNIYIDAVWVRVGELLPTARLDALPNYGARHNVFLAVTTTAAYQVLIDRGTERGYAMLLTGDVGWKLYSLMLTAAALPFRMSTRDPDRRMSRTLRALMIFPFSAKEPLGYQVRAWSEEGRFFTHWTHCPPQTFVRTLVEERTDRGELEAFYQSWCLFDWPGADLLANDGRTGHFTRQHTLSRGDAVCDMCWRTRGHDALV